MWWTALPVAALFVGIGAGPVRAQVNPAEWSLPNVMVEGMRNGSRDRPVRRRDTRRPADRYCPQLPRLRAQHGARDPRIVEVTRLCRRAGYR